MQFANTFGSGIKTPFIVFKTKIISVTTQHEWKLIANVELNWHFLQNYQLWCHLKQQPPDNGYTLLADDSFLGQYYA